MSSKPIRPMRAEHMIRHITEKHLQQDGYLLMQPKIDGMRVLFDNGVPRSRSWKVWTNRYLQAFARDHADLIHGWDCEMIGGLSPDPLRFREDMSGLRSEDGTREFSLYLFDNFDPSWAIYPYEQRFTNCASELLPPLGHYNPELSPEEASVEGLFQEFESEEYKVKVILCPTYIVRSMEEIDALEVQFLEQGWEGAMLRRKGRGYKWGKSTELEGSLTKVKRFKDFEAVITAVEPRMRNDNEPTRDVLGYQRRSAHQDNKTAMEQVGRFYVRTVADPPVEHKVGVFKDVDHTTLQLWWQNRDQLIGKYVTLKQQDFGGGYDKPRTPVFLRFRDPLEM